VEPRLPEAITLSLEIVGQHDDLYQLVRHERTR
jgi:hypothetical protein